MVGAHPDAPGGIANVVRIYREQGLFERWQVRYFATQRPAAAATKLLMAATAWLSYLVQLARVNNAIVHVHTASRVSFWRKCLFLAPAFALARRTVLHVHGGGFARFYQHECGALRQRLIRGVFERADVVIALSPSWRDQLLRIAPRARVRIIANPVTVPAPIEGAGMADRSASSTILFLGRIEAGKGVFDLLEALALVLPDLPATRLLVAGHGEVAALNDRARQLGIEHALQCPGWLQGDAKRIALAQAAVLALPSHAEGLPMVILEAMACGLPVVASEVGGIPDLVRHGTTGLLHPAGDVAALAECLGRVLREPDQAARMARLAWTEVNQRYATAIVMRQIETLYAELAGAKP